MLFRIYPHTYSVTNRPRRTLPIPRKYWGFFVPVYEFPQGVVIDENGIIQPLLKASKKYPPYPIGQDNDDEDEEDDEFSPGSSSASEEEGDSTEDDFKQEEDDEEETPKRKRLKKTEGDINVESLTEPLTEVPLIEVPTEPLTEPTEPLTEVPTEPLTEPTEPLTEPTEPLTESLTLKLPKSLIEPMQKDHDGDEMNHFLLL
jgi:hypothetical protein